MVDISKCDNKKCKIRFSCYRYTAPADKYRQAYAVIEKPVKNPKECDLYWEIKE